MLPLRFGNTGHGYDFVPVALEDTRDLGSNDSLVLHQKDLRHR
jgi:hypothetical protein